MEKDLNYIFNEMPLYNSESFNVFENKDGKYVYNKTEYARFLKFISTSNKRIVTHCIECEEKFPFEYRKNMLQIDNEGSFLIPKVIEVIDENKNSGEIAYLLLDRGEILGLQPPYSKTKDSTYYFEFGFSCNNNDEHKYFLTLQLEILNGIFKVTKIGQYPSMQVLKDKEHNDFSKQLNRYEANEDYKNANKSYNQNLIIGAYAYLRRVFEKQVNYYIEENNIDTTNLKHMEDKIKEIKNKSFSPKINQYLESLYKILSKGVHHLSEEECEKNYIILKRVIDIQLQFEKEKDEEAKQDKEFRKAFSEMNEKYSKNKQEQE